MIKRQRDEMKSRYEWIRSENCLRELSQNDVSNTLWLLAEVECLMNTVEYYKRGHRQQQDLIGRQQEDINDAARVLAAERDEWKAKYEAVTPATGICPQCGKPPAYVGAIYCGAGCSARAEERVFAERDATKAKYEASKTAPVSTIAEKQNAMQSLVLQMQLAAIGRALGAEDGEVLVEIAQRVVAERDHFKAVHARRVDVAEDTRIVLGTGYNEDMIDAARRVMAERNDLRARLDTIATARMNAANCIEQQVREALAAKPDEPTLTAARRVLCDRDELRAEKLKRDQMIVDAVRADSAPLKVECGCIWSPDRRNSYICTLPLRHEGNHRCGTAAWNEVAHVETNPILRTTDLQRILQLEDELTTERSIVAELQQQIKSERVAFDALRQKLARITEALK